MRTPYPVGSVMTSDRRHQELRREGDRITDDRAVREWIASMDRRARVGRAKVVRLSTGLGVMVTVLAIFAGGVSAVSPPAPPVRFSSAPWQSAGPHPVVTPPTSTDLPPSRDEPGLTLPPTDTAP
jgi:hypothetical protein